MKHTTQDKVIRIQGDRLCESLGYQTGTKIDLNIIEQIASGKAGDTIIIDGKTIPLTMYMIGVAQILLKKIKGES